MSLVLTESLVLAKTRSQDLKSVLKLNCWGSGIKDVSLVRQLVNVEVIGFSCNEITSLEDFAYCPKLKELILRKNKIKEISEVSHLLALPNLTSLWLGENPCAETTPNYRKVVLKALPKLTSFDNIPVTKEERQELEELGDEIYEEIPCESATSAAVNSDSYDLRQPSQQLAPAQQQNTMVQHLQARQDTPQQDNNIVPRHQQQQLQMVENTYSNIDNSINESSYFMPTQPASQPIRCLSLQGSVTALNGSQQQNWSGANSTSMNNNNHMTNTSGNFIPRNGKYLNGNILSAVLCLIKELDYIGCEAVQNALHCRMDEFSQ